MRLGVVRGGCLRGGWGIDRVRILVALDHGEMRCLVGDEEKCSEK